MLFALAGEVGDKYGTQVDLRNTEKSDLNILPQLCKSELRQLYITSTNERTFFMSEKKIRRGDVFLADLNPVVGSEEGGNRPVLIVQNNTGNRNSRTTIVAPITRKLTSSYLPVHVIVSPSVTGLQETSSVMLEQIRVMDKERLKEKVGHLPPFLMTLVDRAIRVSVGLKSEYN